MKTLLYSTKRTAKSKTIQTELSESQIAASNKFEPFAWVDTIEFNKSNLYVAYLFEYVILEGKPVFKTFDVWAYQPTTVEGKTFNFETFRGSVDEVQDYIERQTGDKTSVKKMYEQFLKDVEYKWSSVFVHTEKEFQKEFAKLLRKYNYHHVYRGGNAIEVLDKDENSVKF